jgi:hypothetical protein
VHLIKPRGNGEGAISPRQCEDEVAPWDAMPTSRGQAHPTAQSVRSPVAPTFVFLPQNRENNREKLFFRHVISHNPWNISSLPRKIGAGTGKIRNLVAVPARLEFNPIWAAALLSIAIGHGLRSLL